ncbi:OmpA family protein [Sphingomicrobium flavum]|uniref:OmpA family protein n=1 Tax=Sphingomicrobium flavum TaxID=1229164 RepID=UPI0035E3E254
MAIPVSAAAAQPVEEPDAITVSGQLPETLKGLPEGPELKGYISARRGGQMQVAGDNGTNTSVLVVPATEIRSKGGFLGLDKDRLAADALLNGLPVKVQTVEWGGGLVATKVRLSDKDLETASMIRNGTAQRFGEHDVAIADNAAATEALRGRVGDIDKYNVKATTDIFFDTGKWALSAQDQAQLCAAAAEAEGMDNALLLVVGYTDSVGDEDYNQLLSEKRAGKVVNTLQQKCGWAPWRMLTPTGMAEADPAADNATPQGRAQNRRVAVNILVSKTVDGIQ